MLELKSPLIETHKDKIQALLVFAGFIYILWLAIGSLSNIAVKGLDLFSTIKVQRDPVQVGIMTYSNYRIGYSKYQKELPVKFDISINSK